MPYLEIRNGQLHALLWPRRFLLPIQIP